MQDFLSIRVKASPKKVVIEENPTTYPLIGLGKHGAVFKISSHKCVKIYPDPSHCKQEKKVLMEAESSPLIPNFFQGGTNYLIIEYIHGVTLHQYFKARKELTRKLAINLIELLEELDSLPVTRKDASLKNIIITDKGDLKVIDHVNSQEDDYVKPRKLLRGLKELGLLQTFLSYVRKERPYLLQRVIEKHLSTE